MAAAAEATAEATTAAPASPTAPSASAADSTLNDVSDQFKDINLKQNRLLGQDTHAYEHYSLPVTRVSFLFLVAVEYAFF